MKKLGKQNVALLIGIVGLLAIMVGSSYAIFTNEVESTKTQIVEVGKAKVVLTEPASGLNLTSVESMGEYEGISQGTYYDFSIQNTGGISANYKIKLIDNTAALATYNGEVLSEEYLRIGIESNRLDTTVKNINTVDRIIDEDVIYENETINYRMRIWVDFNMLTQEEIQNLSEASIFLKLKVEIEQTLYDINPETFTYTGNYQEYTVPETGYYNIELWGAQGQSFNTITLAGGKGTYTKGTILLTKGEKIYLYIGSQTEYIGTNIFNGSGCSIPTISTISGCSMGFIGGTDTRTGGAATDVRLVTGTDWYDITSLRSRIMVAAGGGGAQFNGATADGTGIVGGNGGGLIADSVNTAIGGTQTSGYAFGIARAAAASQSWTSAGNGYYGGYTTTGNLFGAAGGSSYISGYAGVNSITSASLTTHTNTTKHYSGKYFINGKMADGVNSGNGKARITYLGTALPAKTNTTLNNVRYITSCANGNTLNTGNHWVEIQAIKDGVNLAKGKPVTGTVVEANNTTYSYTNIVDGNISNVAGSSGYGMTQTSGFQCIKIDLGTTYDLDELVLWNYYLDDRIYKDNQLVVGRLSNMGFVLHLYPGSSGYQETSQGKRYSAWD